jgi:pilus assembly protein CpaE
MADEIISLRLKVKNEKIKEEFAGIISSLAGFQMQNSDDPSSFDLLIMEIGDDLSSEFQLIHSIQNSNTAIEVFLTSSRTEPRVLIQALRTGAKEFFPQPINRDEVRSALLKYKERRENLNRGEVPIKTGKIIDVFGSKGGVGTTTVAVNLAASLMRIEGAPTKVALIDMNLLFGEIPLFLGIDATFNWEEIARNIARLDSTYLMSILHKHPSGIYVLPSPTKLVGVNIATPAIIQKLLRMMQTMFDFIVIDSGQSLDDISLKILEISGTVLLVAILSVPCLINIKRLQESFQRLRYPRDENIKVIINRYHKNSMISLKEAEQSINKPIFWQIPNDYINSMSAINQGKIIAAVARESEIAKNFKELASSFTLPEKEEKKEIPPFWGKGALGLTSKAGSKR